MPDKPDALINLITDVPNSLFRQKIQFKISIFYYGPALDFFVKIPKNS